jgi:hypothetical protein
MSSHLKGCDVGKSEHVILQQLVGISSVDCCEDLGFELIRYLITGSKVSQLSVIGLVGSIDFDWQCEGCVDGSGG